MLRVLRALKVLAVHQDQHTISSRHELNVSGVFMVSLVVFLVVRLTQMGTTTQVVFPSLREGLEAGLPRGVVGPVSTGSLHAGVVFDGPEGAVGTTISYALGDVLLKLTLATVEWGSPCVAGVHFGTRVPLVVLKFETQDSTWPEFLSVLLRHKASRDPRWEYTMLQQLEAASDAAKAGKAPWFDIRMLLSGNLTSPRMAQHRFLAVANIQCTEHGTDTHLVDEQLSNCPRAADGTQPVIQHRRWAALQCSGDLVHPEAPQAIAHLSDIMLTGMRAACVQSAVDMMRGVPGVCVSDTK